ncbi:MAG: SET domain-containing protein [Acidobacteriota bacterium]
MSNRKLSYLSPKTVVTDSPIHGKGLFAKEPISRNEIICIKGGAILDRETLRSMPEWFGAAEIQLAEKLFIGPLEEEERDGSMIYSNHSCDPNIGIQGQIVFVAMRDISSGEELTHDWATTDDEDYKIECRCGTVACRKIITGKDWQRPELQQKYSGYMSWYLERKIRES